MGSPAYGTPEEEDEEEDEEEEEEGRRNPWVLAQPPFRGLLSRGFETTVAEDRDLAR